MSILVVAELVNNKLSPATCSALTACEQLSGDVTLLIGLSNNAPIPSNVTQFPMISGVQVVRSRVLEHRLAEDWAACIIHFLAEHSTVVMGSTTFSKNILPRSAALVGVEPITDVIAIESDSCFQRPIYAGDIIQTLQTQQRINFITVRPTAFDQACASESGSMAAIDEVAWSAPEQGLSTWVNQEEQSSERPDLASASLVFSGGRGLGSKANFDRLEALASHYDAAMGATRAAVDADMAPNDWQVGQTGQVVAPAVYVAIGISGATQHIAGMKDSKTILAVNKDPDAPIFSIADYALVADAEDILSLWEEDIRKKGH